MSSAESPSDTGLARLAGVAGRMLSAQVIYLHHERGAVSFLHQPGSVNGSERFESAAATLAREVKRSGSMVLHHDASLDLPFARYLGIPLDDQDGVLAAFADDARPWTAAEIEAAQELGGCFAALAELRILKRSAAAERQRYRELLANVDAVVWEMDADSWRFTYVNDAAERLLGYPVEAWLEQPDFWPAIVHPDDRAAAVELCERAAARGEDHDLEYRAVAADGRVVWLHDHVRAILDEHGGTKALQGVMVDITERKETARALGQSEEQLRQLAEGVDAVFWLYDLAAGRTIYVSPAFEELWGCSRDALLEDPELWRRSVHPDDRARITLDPAQRPERYEMEYRIIRPDGSVRWIHDRGFPVRDESGHVYRTAGVAQDITAHHRLVEQLRRSEEQFRQITEHVRELFWIFDRNFTQTIYMSPAYERLWGRSLEELYSDTMQFIEAVVPEDVPRLRQGMRDIAHAPVEGVEYRIRLPDGTVRWMVSRGAPVRDEHGNVYRVVGTTEDITERKALEAEHAAAESHYRRLVQNAPYAVYVLDVDARFTELNPAAARLLGRPAADMIGRNIAEVIAPEDLPRAMESIRSRMAGDFSVSDIELRMIHASGELRLARIRATAIVEDGKYVGTHGIAADITEERAREEQARLLAAALHSLEEGVAIARPEGALIYVNSTYAELLGFDRNARPLPDFTASAADGQQSKVLETAVQTVLHEGRWAGRITFRHADAERLVPLEFILGRIDSAERETLLFIIARDITAEIAREEHLRRAERLASVGTLIGGVAHELNNPLNAITSFATLLLETPRTDEEREDIATIHREALRAAKIVADLRLLARRTQDDPREHVQVDLNDVVMHVLRTRRYAHETGNISATTDLSGDLPPVWGDPGQLEQVVINLVVNAEQALEQSAGDCRLILRTRASAGGVSLHVIDNGTGMPAHVMDRIFDPFFTTKATGEGTGLGLSLVHSIVVEHGGDVRVESQEGRGTAFHLEFPAVRGTGAAATTEPAPAPQRPLRILIVDDEPAIRRALVRYLSRRGHSVDEAGDGAEALRLLELATSYDVILSDLRMPGLSGDRMLERLREQPGDMHRRVMFLTGDAASGHAARILAEADAPVVFKPVDLPELARRIEEWAEQLAPRR